MSKRRFLEYPDLPDLKYPLEKFRLISVLRTEQGASGAPELFNELKRKLIELTERAWALKPDPGRAAREPDSLNGIRKLRPKGPRRIWRRFDSDVYGRRLPAALLGRMAGCILGAPVEFWPVQEMKDLARENGDPFPPRDYWRYVPRPYSKRYRVSPISSYTRGAMDSVAVDDDIAYTLLGLLIVEDYGPDFRLDDVGKAWKRYLPFACTAEEIALGNLNAGVSAVKSGVKDNPFTEWIGADIRSDPWAYMAPGFPEKAAQMAWTDSMISHRRNGVYGAMFFSAAIAAGFAVDDTVEALRIGLTEIPAECAMARTVRWALAQSRRVRNYRQARDLMESYFRGMDGVHTLNNACLTIWGLTIGGKNFSKIIGETVAMGMDNDCTAATAGSLAGAVLGLGAIPKRWYTPFNNTVRSYLKGHPRFRIDDLIARFTRQAIRIAET